MLTFKNTPIIPNLIYMQILFRSPSPCSQSDLGEDMFFWLQCFQDVMDRRDSLAGVCLFFIFTMIDAAAHSSEPRVSNTGTSLTKN